jgi:DNA-binding response OmpR family regulator
MRLGNARHKGVLLVSHDKELRRQVHSCLSALRMPAGALTTVGNGRDCLAVVAKLRPLLMILDDSLPDQDGVELVRALHHGVAEVLVVYLTSHHTLELERAVRQSGVLYYTEKPVDSALLSRVLATVFAPVRQTG